MLASGRTAARARASLLGIGVVAVLLSATPALAGRTVIITGGGWGHGIGMSQYGAYGRARAGHTATRILKHYYTGVRVGVRKMPRVRVGLLQGRRFVSVTSSAFRSNGGYVVFRVKGGARIVGGGPSSTWRVERTRSGGMRVYKNGTKVVRRGRSVFGGPNRPLVAIYERFGSLLRVVQKYRSYAHGRMYFGTYRGSCELGYCLRLVLSLPMAKYLYGLGEMPSSWPQAALRSQAIAGRTHAYRRIVTLGQHRSPCDCAVYDSTVDQAYIGDAKRSGAVSYWDNWKRAVNGTRRRVLLYAGRPIQALYSSSSGGHTESNHNVWGGARIPYLRGVRDWFDRVDANPNHRWRVRMRWTTFASRLNAAYGIGALRRFRLVKPFGVSGRVTVVKGPDRGGVRIVGSKKTVRTSGWSLRSVLNLRDTLFRVRIERTTSLASATAPRRTSASAASK